jgi:RimJ/RimL family protein N-acetyltransferase
VLAARRFLGTCTDVGDPQPFGNYEIRRRSDGQAIGGLGFHGPADDNGSVTIGYGLIPSVRGEGYASEALRALLEFARAHGLRDQLACACPPGAPSVSRASTP